MLNSDFMSGGARTIANASVIRFDQWASIADAPTTVPLEMKPKGLVFRGMRDFDAACHYAREVQAFFEDNGYLGAVFVLRGPTSTTKEKFEVVDAAHGYPIAFHVLSTAEVVNEALSDRLSEPAPERNRQRA